MTVFSKLKTGHVAIGGVLHVNPAWEGLGHSVTSVVTLVGRWKASSFRRQETQHLFHNWSCAPGQPSGLSHPDFLIFRWM